MIQPEPIGFLNTVVPLLVLGALAVILPHLLARRDSRSHWEVFVAVWAAAGLVLVAGAGVFAALYAAGGSAVGEAFGAAPWATGWVFLKLSGYGAIVWGPVLLLTWFAMAQRVERRRGEDAVREGRR